MATSYTLECEIEKVKNEAIERIKAIMLVGAGALCDARRKEDGYWIEHKAKEGEALLIWRSQATGTPAVQVVLPSGDDSPELIARLHTLAVDKTAQIVRECAGKIAELDRVADLTVRAYAAIAP